jgi:hypothetical protein
VAGARLCYLSPELLVSRLTEDMRSQIQTLVDTALSDRESIWG